MSEPIDIFDIEKDDGQADDIFTPVPAKPEPGGPAPTHRVVELSEGVLAVQDGGTLYVLQIP